jgi:hypothetical protein
MRKAVHSYLEWLIYCFFVCRLANYKTVRDCVLMLKEGDMLLNFISIGIYSFELKIAKMV